MRIKVTMADGKVITGERQWYDVFLDGWFTTRLHDYELKAENGTFISKGRKAKVRNGYFVIEEDA